MRKIIAFGAAPLALVLMFAFPTSSSAEAVYSLQAQMQAAMSRPARPARGSALPPKQTAVPTVTATRVQTATQTPAPAPAPTRTPTPPQVPIQTPPSPPAIQAPPPAPAQTPATQAPTQTPIQAQPTTQAVNVTVERNGRSDTDELAQRKTLLGEAVGYGKGATGGANGKMYRVTTLANGGPGSLRSAVGSADALWIVFDVSGTIDLGRKSLRIKSNKTIDGRGARILLKNAPVQIFDAKNVIVENIEIGANDQMIGMRLLRSDTVWIDHVSFLGGITNGGDPLYANLLAIMDGSSNVTVSWSRFANQDKGIEIGHGNTSAYANDESMYVTLHHNYMNAGRRNPRVNRAHVHAFNNVVDRWACNGYGMASANNGKLFTEGNVFTAQGGCTNVCKAGANAAIRSGDIVGAKSCTVVKTGIVFSQNNLFQSGAQLAGRNVSLRQIFNPQNRYAYAVETADAAMEQKVISGAGATR